MSRIHVAGLRRTKNDIVVEQVKDILQAASLQDLLVRSLNALQRLQELNVFKHVHVQLDTVRGEEGKTEGVAVMFVVNEHGWLTSTIAANAGTQSGDAVRFWNVLLWLCVSRVNWPISTFNQTWEDFFVAKCVCVHVIACVCLYVSLWVWVLLLVCVCVCLWCGVCVCMNVCIQYPNPLPPRVSHCPCATYLVELSS